MDNTKVYAMPRYKCHKEVTALKIVAINGNPNGSADLFFEDEKHSTINVDNDYVSKHKPQVGGYYVVYDGGYASWSPADVFEDGYTPMQQEG